MIDKDTPGSERAEAILDSFSPRERQVIKDEPSVSKALSSLAEYSPVLAQALANRPDLSRWLFLEKSFQRAAETGTLEFELGNQVRNISSLPAFQSCLRRFRLKELARTAVRDLIGLADLAEVMSTLTALAEVCLNHSLQFAVQAAAEKYGTEEEGLGVCPIILGMGKFGARETNYSSDVDLIYLYRNEPHSTGSPEPQIVAEFIFTTVNKAMSEITEEGLVFRVDLDLRPGGKDGALAQSVETALRHYQVLGQPWERMALLKARPVAGDISAGVEFLDSLTPFIFRRYLDFMALEELRNLKDRFTREIQRKLLRKENSSRVRPEINVKLSTGGIREIEFFAQSLTIAFGGRLAHLRQISTLKALLGLTAEKIITTEDVEQLSEAYVFLRTVEHRLQLRELRQTHTLPRERAALDMLARSMNFTKAPTEEFLSELTVQMERVNARFQLLLAEPLEGDESEITVSDEEVAQKINNLLNNLDNQGTSLRILKDLGFKKGQASLSSCRELIEGHYLPEILSRYRRQLEKLVPAMIANASTTPDPDRALNHLERFLTRVGPLGGFLLLLVENPKLIKLLTTLFGTSDYLAGVLISNPSILDSLVDRRSARLVKDRSILKEDLATFLPDDLDLEDCLSLIRRFKNDEILRIGLFDILGELDFNQVQNQLAFLAEVVMESSLAKAAEQVAKGNDVPVVVMGLGKLGGREMNYSSDLDLLFILGGRGNSGRAMEQAVRVVQRFISFLTMPLAEGPGYTIDSRLRPSGTFGPLVVTPSSLARYHEKSQLWERQALIKIRLVLGPERLGKRVKTLARKAVYQKSLPPDAALLINDLRRRMTRERARLKPDTVNFKFLPGGLVDIEFLTQYLQMRYGGKIGGNLRSSSTGIALRALHEKGLGPVGLDKVSEAYNLIARVSSRLGLTYGRSGDEASYLEQEVSSLKLPGLLSDPLTEVREAMELTSRVYTEVLGTA